MKGAIRDPRSAWASSISPSAVPDASSGITISLRHQAVSVSAIRRELSRRPKPPLDDNGPEPLRELQLDQRHDRQLVVVDVVLRPWLREADGLADHHQQLRGYRSLRSSFWKVVPLSPAKRSNAVTSMKENESAPSRTAAAIPSSGTPARSKPAPNAP